MVTVQPILARQNTPSAGRPLVRAAVDGRGGRYALSRALALPCALALPRAVALRLPSPQRPRPKSDRTAVLSRKALVPPGSSAPLRDKPPGIQRGHEK